MKLFAIVAALVIGTSPAFAQEGEEEDQMTPAQALELLNDAQRLMEKAEELLHDSSRGKAIETEKELMKRLERELKDEPAELQKRILEKVGKLVEKAEKKEKDAAEKLNEVIRKARSAAGQDPQKQQQQQKQDPAKSKPRQAGAPAKQVYDPNRTDPPSKFKSRGDSGSWGNLPAAVREAMRASSRDDVPPEFQELWKRYYESLEGNR